MKATVVTMNYNLAPFIGETIKSVLAQTFTDFEYLIYDDGSTDNSVEIIMSFNDPRIRLVELKENGGSPEKIINMAMKDAQTPYLSIIPSDDVWHETYLEKVIGKLEKDPIFGACFSHVVLIDEKGENYNDPCAALKLCELENRTQEGWLEGLYYGNLLLGSMTLRLPLKVGEFDISLGHMADYDFFIRLIKETPIWIIQERLVKIRIRGKDNRSAQTPENNTRHVKNLGILQRRYYRKHTAKSLEGKTKLIIVTPFYEMKAFSKYVVSLINTVEMLIRRGIEFDFWEMSGDSYVDRARNTLCGRFLESDGTHLLFIDSDESWDHEAIPKMMEMDKDIIGGAYPQKNNWNTWSSIPLPDKDWRIDGELKNNSTIVKAQCVSAGFMMLKRSAMERFEEHYADLVYVDMSADRENSGRVYTRFFECSVQEGRRYGEDYTFCNRWREMGGELWIFPNIDFGHYGIKGWYGNYEKYLRNGQKNEKDQSE